MPTLTTLYSVRDALGQELWWTTRRKSAVELARDFNVVGVGARLYQRACGKAYAATAFVYSDTLENGADVGLSAHQLPVAMFKVTRVKAPTPKCAPEGFAGIMQHLPTLAKER